MTIFEVSKKIKDIKVNCYVDEVSKSILSKSKVVIS